MDHFRETQLSSNVGAADKAAIHDTLATTAKKLRGGSGQPAVYSPAFSLIRVSVELGQIAVENPTDIGRLWKNFEKIERTVRKLKTTLYRAG